MKKILVIGSGWEQYALIQTIKEEGHSVIATNPKMNADGFKLADSYYVKDSRDIKAHISIAQTHGIDAVVTDNCDYSFYTAAVVASKLKLPFATIRSAIYSNDKFEQRESCKRTGIGQPEYYKVKKPDELFAAAHRIGYPIILKPVDSRGTFGVTIINNDEELEAAFYDAIDNSPSRTLIAEKFIHGTLVTVDGFCFKNGHRALAVASRRFEEGPKPVTKEIIYPAQFTDEINLRLLKNHEAVVESLEYSYGHTHGEYILTADNEIFLVECTNRGGGVYTSTVIVPLLTDINLNRILLHQSLGDDDFEAEGTRLESMKRSVILTFLDFEVGHVIKKINVQEMLDKPYTVRFRSFYGENDMVESIENCASRHSMLVLQGDDAKAAQANLSAFKEALRVDYYK
ncbi:MAG: ATP-grasp domain-containing protein [Chitinophagaceae bacterium]